MKLKPIGILALLVIFYLPVLPLPSAQPEAVQSKMGTYIPDSWKQEMLDEVNKIRQAGCRCGRKYMPPVPPVIWNGQLEKAAFLHAKDMDKNNFMGHRGSNGSSIGDRATKSHYKWQSVGENVSWNYDTPREAVLGWKNSPGHCRNMMNPGYKDMGASKYGLFWAQMFGRPMK